MLKYGRISDIDAEKGLAKVSFPDDDMVSDWLKVLVPKSKDDSYSVMFDTDEHVAVMMDEHCENGVILGAVYDTGKKPDGGNADKVRVKFKDGAAIEYDRSNHTFTIEGIEKAVIKTKEATITADTKVKIDCSDNEITGDLKIGGKLDVTGDVSTDGKIEALQDIKSTSGDVIATVTSLKLHVHTGVTSGPGLTGQPSA